MITGGYKRQGHPHGTWQDPFLFPKPSTVRLQKISAPKCLQNCPTCAVGGPPRRLVRRAVTLRGPALARPSAHGSQQSSRCRERAWRLERLAATEPAERPPWAAEGGWTRSEPLPVVCAWPRRALMSGVRLPGGGRPYAPRTIARGCRCRPVLGALQVHWTLPETSSCPCASGGSPPRHHWPFRRGYWNCANPASCEQHSTGCTTYSVPGSLPGHRSPRPP